MSKSLDYNEILELHNLCKSDPQRYIQTVSRRIEENPSDSKPYFYRYFGWMRVDDPHRALEDLDRVIELAPDQLAFLSRGKVYRHLGKYREAIADFERGESLHPRQWEMDAMGPYYQADCHARLGNEAQALAYCGRLPDDFWTPGLRGAPAGNRAEIAKELRRIAIDARRKKAGKSSRRTGSSTGFS